MQADFWHERWQSGQIGFHEADTNPLLLAHFAALKLAAGSRLFLPLCGKTRDIAWLLAQGYRVAGAELSAIAAEQLFSELGARPRISRVGELRCYQANNLDIFVGDIFMLTGDLLGPVDAVYDRAALVALPPAMRKRYTAHLRAITAAAPQLLICFEYDQSFMDGPPFSVDEDEVRQHYAGHFQLSVLAEQEVPGGLKGKTAATERVWLLSQRSAEFTAYDSSEFM